MICQNGIDCDCNVTVIMVGAVIVATRDHAGVQREIQQYRFGIRHAIRWPSLSQMAELTKKNTNSNILPKLFVITSVIFSSLSLEQELANLLAIVQFGCSHT